eukprot:10225047-Lingulodinium_polyedra.AAC.1
MADGDPGRGFLAAGEALAGICPLPGWACPGRGGAPARGLLGPPPPQSHARGRRGAAPLAATPGPPGGGFPRLARPPPPSPVWVYPGRAGGGVIA